MEVRKILELDTRAQKKKKKNLKIKKSTTRRPPRETVEQQSRTSSGFLTNGTMAINIESKDHLCT